MKELKDRNRQIAAYIESLGSSFPEESQQSFLLQTGGSVGSSNGVNAMVNQTSCSNQTLDCKDSVNQKTCTNMEGCCGDSSNGEMCYITLKPSPTNTNPFLACTCK